MILTYKFAELMQWAQRIYGSDAQLQMTPYAFSADFGDVAANLLIQRTVEFTANADFILLDIVHNASNGRFPLSIFITDNTTGEPFSNGFVPSITFVNNQEMLTMMGVCSPAYPQWFAGKSSISVQIQNDTNAMNEYQISLIGVLVRKMS